MKFYVIVLSYLFFYIFRLLDKSLDGIIYIVMCFFCRIVEVLGCFMFVIVSFVIIVNLFFDNVVIVFVSIYSLLLECRYNYVKIDVLVCNYFEFFNR